MRACAAWWCARVLLRKTRTCGLLGSVLSITWRERQRTSSAELERSAAISLGMQLDSSPLVLVAEVSSLLALRPRPIVRDVGLSLLRAPGEGLLCAIRQSTVRHGQARSVRGARRHYDRKGQGHTSLLDRYFSSKDAVAGRG